MIIVVNSSEKEMDYILKNKIEKALADLISVEGIGVYKGGEVIIKRDCSEK